MKLITEEIQKVEFITEKVGNKKNLYIEGIFLQGDICNRNGRMYPMATLTKEVNRYNENFIQKGRALGELGHPDGPTVNLDRVSHTILETWWDGKTLMGKIKLLLSPGFKKMGIVSCKGDQAAMLLINGVTLGISSRGVGSLKEVKGQNIVQDDFELVCFDLVSSPSTPGAYVFQDVADKDKFNETVEQKPIVDDRMKKLMGKLDSFLTK